MLTWKDTGLCFLESCIAKQFRRGGESEEKNPKCCSTTQRKLEHFFMHHKLTINLTLAWVQSLFIWAALCLWSMHHALCSVTVGSTCCTICCQSSRRNWTLLFIWVLWNEPSQSYKPLPLFQLCKQACCVRSKSWEVCSCNLILWWHRLCKTYTESVYECMIERSLLWLKGRCVKQVLFRKHLSLHHLNVSCMELDPKVKCFITFLSMQTEDDHYIRLYLSLISSPLICFCCS